MKVRSYESGDAAQWDAFVERSVNGTFLHSRNFIDYHGDRFQDRSMICEDRRGATMALFPAAIDPDDGSCVSSHPGATFGGLVTGAIAPTEAEELVAVLVDAYRKQGFNRLLYKAVPHHLVESCAEADRFALWRQSAQLVRSDLWNVIRPVEARTINSKHARSIRLAESHGLIARERDGIDEYRKFHRILVANLELRHRTRPVHSVDELLDLRERLGQRASLWIVEPQEQDDELLAGAWVFRFGQSAWHTQYIASTAAGRNVGAVHLLLNTIVETARENGIRTVSLGNSTESGGHRLNESLARFKSRFGYGYVAHQHFQIDLDGNGVR